MNAVGASLTGKQRVAADQKQDAALGAKTRERRCGFGAARVIIVTKDKGCARREGARRQRWIRRSRTVGREGKGKRRARRSHAALCIERARRRC